MNNKDTIVQIAIRVADKLAEAGEKVSVEQVMQAMGLADTPAELPGLLLVAKEHGCGCHNLYESGKLNGAFRICCALENDYQVELDKVDVVVLFQLTTEDMCKLVSGITDTPYTKLAAKALLMGKKVYAPREEVELYQYPVGGLGSYQCMLQAKLTKLISFGLKVCPMDKLEECILGEAPVPEVSEPECSTCDTPVAEEICEEVCAEAEPEEKEMTFAKRVITERDIIEANREKVKVIRITSKNILTPLAKDAATKRNIRLIKE